MDDKDSPGPDISISVSLRSDMTGDGSGKASGEVREKIEIRAIEKGTLFRLKSMSIRRYELIS